MAGGHENLQQSMNKNDLVLINRFQVLPNTVETNVYNTEAEQEDNLLHKNAKPIRELAKKIVFSVT